MNEEPKLSEATLAEQKAGREALAKYAAEDAKNKATAEAEEAKLPPEEDNGEEDDHPHRKAAKRKR